MLRSLQDDKMGVKLLVNSALRKNIITNLNLDDNKRPVCHPERILTQVFPSISLMLGEIPSGCQTVCGSVFVNIER